MRVRSQILFVGMMAGIFLPSFSFAATPELLEIYERRPDLQVAFDPETLQAVAGTAAGFLIDLEDWARQYGWQAYPELASYAPSVLPVDFAGGSLPAVTADYYIVIDDASGAILAAQGADVSWPIASLTKLITTKTALDAGLDIYGTGSVRAVDDVGGAKLYVSDGTSFRIKDLLYATLVGSANNAANAIARLTGVERAEFVERMNAFAQEHNLSRTHFADPTGIELENVSTAREVAYMVREIFANADIRRMSGTSAMHIEALNDPNYIRDINNTNWLLYDPAYDDVYVTGGKTGYLDESGWNLVVRMHPMGLSQERSVLIVLFGADGRRQSFDDAHVLAHWAWSAFDWSAR